MASKIINVTDKPVLGISWFNMVMGLFLLAFILYIAANGSLPKYQQLLF